MNAPNPRTACTPWRCRSSSICAFRKSTTTRVIAADRDLQSGNSAGAHLTEEEGHRGTAKRELEDRHRYEMHPLFLDLQQVD